MTHAPACLTPPLVCSQKCATHAIPSDPDPHSALADAREQGTNLIVTLTIPPPALASAHDPRAAERGSEHAHTGLRTAD